MKKLTKSKKDKVIFGVCGGLAEYFERDPVLFRILFVVLLFMSGFIPFMIAYIIVALIMPEENGEKIVESGEEALDKKGLFWLITIFVLAMLIIPFMFLIGMIGHKISEQTNIEHTYISSPRDMLIR